METRQQHSYDCMFDERLNSAADAADAHGEREGVIKLEDPREEEEEG